MTLESSTFCLDYLDLHRTMLGCAAGAVRREARVAPQRVLGFPRAGPQGTDRALPWPALGTSSPTSPGAQPRSRALSWEGTYPVSPSLQCTPPPHIAQR